MSRDHATALQPRQQYKTTISLKKTKQNKNLRPKKPVNENAAHTGASRVQQLMSMIPELWEAEVGGSLEARNLRLDWAT